MTIPATRAELIAQIETSFGKLRAEIVGADPSIASLPATEDWTVSQLLAVRLWWTERVVDWIEAGQRGEVPVVPAEGYGWRDTPRLNDATATAALDSDGAALLGRLDNAVARVLDTVASLDDRSLLEVGVFPWAKQWPVSRWLSVNTARQYTTARTLVRKAIRIAREQHPR